MNKEVVDDMFWCFICIATIGLAVSKACGLLNISWLWVFSPLWLTLGFLFVFGILLLISIGIFYFIFSKACNKDLEEEKDEEKSE